jgi:hypothetical protein
LVLVSVHALFRVRDLAELSRLIHWARRLPLFDSADQAAGGNVEIIYDGRIIGSVVCALAELQYAAEQICTSVIIAREDGWLRPAFPPPAPKAKRQRASTLPANVINMRTAA